VSRHQWRAPSRQPIYFAGGPFEGCISGVQFFGSFFEKIFSLALWGIHLIQRVDLDKKNGMSVYYYV